MRELVSHILLELGVVVVNTKEPFTLTSGKKSPIYFNCRRLISNPAAMATISGLWAWPAFELAPSYVVGGETAGMPFAQHLAHTLGLPYAYVRKGNREHGTLGKVEGLPGEGMYGVGSSVLIEDLITDGGSKLPFIRSLKEARIPCKHCFVVLDRDQGGALKLYEEGVLLHSLVTAGDVLEYGRSAGCISKHDFEAAMEALWA